MKKKRILAILLVAAITLTLLPVTSFAATKKKSVRTYVFFGVDSRRNDDLWKSKNGKKITTDRSSHGNNPPFSDVIMLLVVDDNNKTIDVVSIYRDTLLDISGKGTKFRKINQAYSKYGPNHAVKVLEKNLGIDIDGYVSCNFKGVADVIDKLGGVKIDIEDDRSTNNEYKNVPDVMNFYIDEMNRIYGKHVRHVRTTTNVKKLNGIQAVAYARVRYTDGNDMRRSVRQRDILSLMKDQYWRCSPTKRRNVRKAILKNVDTSLSATMLITEFKTCSKYKLRKSNGFPYFKKQCMIKIKKEDTYVTLPCTLRNNVVRLHQYVYKQKGYNPGKTVKNYSKKVVNLTNQKHENRNVKLDNKY